MTLSASPTRQGIERGNRLFETLYSRLVLGVPWLHALLIRVLLPDVDVSVELFGSRLLINKRKEAGYWRAYRAARSSPVLWNETGSLLSLALILEPGDTFVDVGANVGLFSSTLARFRQIQPSGRFYAFEANPNTAGRLRRSVPAGAVDVFDLAVSDRNGMLTFVNGSTSLTFGVAESGGALQFSKRTVEVPARRLDEMDIEGSSLVLKIDVESHERQVLEGAAGLFEAGRVKAVYLDDFADPAVPAFFTERGFSLFDGRSLSPGLSSNLLAIRSDRIGTAHDSRADFGLMTLFDHGKLP
jgi:FkbM family methyltransferase